jgi:hypothetical protein
MGTDKYNQNRSTVQGSVNGPQTIDIFGTNGSHFAATVTIVPVFSVR